MSALLRRFAPMMIAAVVSAPLIFGTAFLVWMLPSPAHAAIDEIAPTTKSQVRQVDSHDWTITLVATDDLGGSGVATTYYQLDNHPEAQGTSIALTSPGRHTITYWSVDNAGNVETAKTRVFTPLDMQLRCASCHGLGGGLQ